MPSGLQQPQPLAEVRPQHATANWQVASVTVADPDDASLEQCDLKSLDLDIDLEDVDGVEPPTWFPLAQEFVSLPDTGRVGVVGESYYQEALGIVAEGRISGDDFESHIPVVAALVPEPTNKWDKNAVRIDVVLGDRSLKVGYLARHLAEEYQPELLKLQHGGLLGTCPARITGGGAKHYGIYLHIAYPRDLRIANGSEHPFITTIRDGAALLRGEWSCTVTKEEHHQDVLRQYGPGVEGEYPAVVASPAFCKITSGRHTGMDAIEVRIADRRVGELTRAMTERYGGVVREVLNMQYVPKCHAYTKNTPKGTQIELLMPPDPARYPPRSNI